MKRSSLWLTALVLISLTCAGQALARPRTPRLDARERRIEWRIRQGARSGELTRPEVLRLRGGLCRLHGREARFWSDGHLSFGERRALHRRANHLSRRVFRMKHNWRHRF